MGVFGQLFLQDGVVRCEETPCHSVYDPIRGKAGAVFSRCALQRGAEPGVEGFEVGKAVPQGNIGQVVVGAMAGSWVNITSAVQIATDSEGKAVMLQQKLDGAFPGILTMLFVLFAWWLMAKKNVTPIKVLILFVVIGFLGSVSGLLG